MFLLYTELSEVSFKENSEIRLLNKQQANIFYKMIDKQSAFKTQKKETGYKGCH